MMNRVEIWGFKVFSDNLNIISVRDRRKLLFTISPNSYGLATKNETFNIALKSADYLVLDGVYFALASIIYKRKNIKRNQGPQILYHFLNEANRIGGKVFFLGTTKSTLRKIENRAVKEFPNVKTESHAPSFNDQFTDIENKEIIYQINKVKPDVLFIGLSAPKQEIWAYQNIARLNVNLVCCIGGVFDWYAGNYCEIQKFWWKLRLGWLIRYFQRPEIILRDSKNDAIFFKHLIIKNLLKK